MTDAVASPGGLLDSRGDRSRRSKATMAALTGLVALFSGIAAMNAVATPAYLPPDEHAHVAYGYALTELDLPTVFDLQTGGPYTYRSDRTIYTANHPPLYHATIGPVIRVLNTVVEPDTAVRVTRLLMLAIGAFGVVATAGLLSEVVPDRASVWVTGTALVFVVPDLSYRFAHLYNDALGYATGMAALWIGTRIHNRGPTPRRSVALSIFVMAACLTRVSAVPFAALALAIAALGIVRHADKADRWRVAVRSMAVISLPALVTAGPFYLRNRRLYGDLTGGDQLYELVGRVPAPFSYVVDPQQLASTYRNMWITGPDQAGTALEVVALASAGFFWSVTILAVVGLVRMVVAWFRGQDRDRIVPVLACGLAASAVLAGFSQHVTGGGLPHARYLFGAFFVVGLLAALTLDTLPRPVHVGGVAVAAACLVAASLVRVDRMLSTYWFPAEGSRAGRWRDFAEALGPVLTSVAAAAVLTSVVGSGVLVHGLSRLRSDEHSLTPEPERPRPRP